MPRNIFPPAIIGRNSGILELFISSSRTYLCVSFPSGILSPVKKICPFTEICIFYRRIRAWEDDSDIIRCNNYIHLLLTAMQSPCPALEQFFLLIGSEIIALGLEPFAEVFFDIVSPLGVDLAGSVFFLAETLMAELIAQTDDFG